MKKIYSLSDLPGGYADDGFFEKQMHIKFLLNKDEWSTSDVLSLFDEKDTKILVLHLIKSSVTCEKLSFSRSVLNDSGIEQFFFKPDVILNCLKSKELELPEQVLQRWKNALQADEQPITSFQQGTHEGGVTACELSHTTWFRDIWKVEGRPTGAPFFNALKKYVKQKGSPILDWYNTSADGPGVKLKTKTTTIDHYSRSQIQKLASKFKQEDSSQKSMSSEK